MHYTVKQLTTKKLLEKSLSSGAGKLIADRRIPLQAALSAAVPSFCPTDTGILWKLYIYIYICARARARARVCVCVCVCVYVCMKEYGLYTNTITTTSCCKCIYRMMSHYV